MQVALVETWRPKVQSLIETASQPDNPAEADTAIFPSISNCQDGLRGVCSAISSSRPWSAGDELPSLRSFYAVPGPGLSRMVSGCTGGGRPAAADEQLAAAATAGWIADEAFAASASRSSRNPLCAPPLVMEKQSRPQRPVAAT
ncbi:MAG: malonyl-CoA decarboxylase family protein [Geminicoccaceae bacterium]